MGEAFAGESGSGSVLVYAVPRDHFLRLELLTFVVTTGGAAGIHKARVSLFDTKLSKTAAVLRDLNEGGGSETLTYTYGIGLNASACVTVTGWEMTDALPETDLAPGTEITVSMVNDAGSTIVGDAIGSVVLYGTFYNSVDTAQTPMPKLITGLLPGSVA